MRRWREADREPFAALNADPEVMRYFPAPLDRAASDATVDRIEDLFLRQGFGLWALEVSATGEFIGFTGLNPMPGGVPGAGGMEVGWRLARGAWHQGYASEAAAAAASRGLPGSGPGGSVRRPPSRMSRPCSGLGPDPARPLRPPGGEASPRSARPHVATAPAAGRGRFAVRPHVDPARAPRPPGAPGHPLRPHFAYRLSRPGVAAVQPGPPVAYRLPRPGAVAPRSRVAPWIAGRDHSAFWAPIVGNTRRSCDDQRFLRT
jgi:hypothetical protein